MRWLETKASRSLRIAMRMVDISCGGSDVVGCGRAFAGLGDGGVADGEVELMSREWKAASRLSPLGCEAQNFM